MAHNDPELENATQPNHADGVRNTGSIEDLSTAGATVLEAAQTLRRSVAQGPMPAEALAMLAVLEATLDSLGASLSELRGPLLEQVEPVRTAGAGSRAQELDAARLVAQIGEDLSEAATSCGELRDVLASARDRSVERYGGVTTDRQDIESVSPRGRIARLVRG